MEEYTIENLKNEIRLIEVILKYNVKPLVHVLRIEKISDNISNKDDIDTFICGLSCFYDLISRIKKENVEVFLFDLRTLINDCLMEFAHIWLYIKNVTKTNSSLLQENKEIEKTLSQFKPMISKEFLEELEKILKGE